MSDIIYKSESYLIQGAVFDVYRQLGCGFLEAVYQEALEIELSGRNIPFTSQEDISINYKGQLLKKRYRPDLICYNSIIIELKAAKAVAPEHKAQLINYLKATDMKLGLLVNFGSYPKAEIIRMAL